MTQPGDTPETLTMVNTRKLRQIVREFLVDSEEVNPRTQKSECRHCFRPVEHGHDEECPVLFGERVMEGTE